MKTFEDLSVDQRREAVETAITELKANLKSGLLILDKELSNEEIFNLAVVAAEESDYTDEGKIKFEIDDEIPPYYLGGCV